MDDLIKLLAGRSPGDAISSLPSVTTYLTDFDLPNIKWNSASLPPTNADLYEEEEIEIIPSDAVASTASLRLVLHTFENRLKSGCSLLHGVYSLALDEVLSADGVQVVSFQTDCNGAFLLVQATTEVAKSFKGSHLNKKGKEWKDSDYRKNLIIILQGFGVAIEQPFDKYGQNSDEIRIRSNILVPNNENEVKNLVGNLPRSQYTPLTYYTTSDLDDFKFHPHGKAPYRDKEKKSGDRLCRLQTKVRGENGIEKLEQCRKVGRASNQGYCASHFTMLQTIDAGNSKNWKPAAK